VKEHHDENLGTKKNPGKSCIHILSNGPRIPKSGHYYIKEES